MLLKDWNGNADLHCERWEKRVVRGIRRHGEMEISIGVFEHAVAKTGDCARAACVGPFTLGLYLNEYSIVHLPEF